ncbi:hypothetical protein ACFL04_03150 [Patescibacteria group bacterium]
MSITKPKISRRRTSPKRPPKKMGLQKRAAWWKKRKRKVPSTVIPYAMREYIRKNKD